jgi:hypothetical protein
MELLNDRTDSLVLLENFLSCRPPDKGWLANHRGWFTGSLAAAPILAYSLVGSPVRCLLPPPLSSCFLDFCLSPVLSIDLLLSPTLNSFCSPSSTYYSARSTNQTGQKDRTAKRKRKRNTESRILTWIKTAYWRKKKSLRIRRAVLWRACRKNLQRFEEDGINAAEKSNLFQRPISHHPVVPPRYAPGLFILPVEPRNR